MRLGYFLIGLLFIFCFNDIAIAKHKSRQHTTKKLVYTRAIATPIYGTNQLRDQLNTIIQSANVNADIGVYVKSMQHGDALFTRNIHQSLTPASTMKVLTAEAALIYLGPNYRFATQLLTDAKTVKNGILQGNLYVVFSGDPTLTFSDLAELLLALRDEQINAIAGNVYIDNTAYDQSFYGPGWLRQDKNNSYGAPISASIVNHNVLTNRVPQQRLTQVKTSSKYFNRRTRRTPALSRVRNSCSLRLANASGGTISIDGCMPRGGGYTSAVSNVVTDIPEYNRALFKALLRRLNVSVFGSVTFKTAPENLSMIGSHNSEPLRVLITDMLKKSDNVIAGALFKKLGQLYSREPGSWSNGSLAVSQILARNAGVGISGLRILDGSGLSPDNLATPAQMMQVLDFAYHNTPISEDFITALPIAGVDGTLKHRMWNIARKVRAKTGTISGVVSLAGYAQAPDEPLAFVIMINGTRGNGWRYKEMEDKIVTALTRYRR